MNQWIERVLISSLKHQPPFTDEEIVNITRIRISYMHEEGANFEWFSHCPNVKFLVIDSSEISHLNFVHHWPKLGDVEVKMSPLKDISALAACPNLYAVEFRHCLIEDIEPLRYIPKLKNVKIIGNPLNDQSWYDILPLLKSKTFQGRYETDPYSGKTFYREPPEMTVAHSEEPEWKITCELNRRGMPVSYTKIILQGGEIKHNLIIPGLKYTPDPGRDGCLGIYHQDLLDLIKDPDLTVERILDFYNNEYVPRKAREVMLELLDKAYPPKK